MTVSVTTATVRQTRLECDAHPGTTVTITEPVRIESPDNDGSTYVPRSDALEALRVELPDGWIAMADPDGQEVTRTFHTQRCAVGWLRAFVKRQPGGQQEAKL